MKSGRGGDILVSNVVANPPPPCAIHNFSDWEPAKIYASSFSNELLDHGVQRICHDCGRCEWTEGASA